MSKAQNAAIVIRSIESGDVAGLYELICALADSENEREYLTVTPERLEETGAGDNPSWRGFVAEYDGRLVGYATYTQDFHVWSGSPRFSLDDIYVRPEFRSHGLGEKLMRQVFEQAEMMGAYVSWTVQPGNDRAIAFYKRLGADYKVTGKCGWRA